MVSSYLIHFFPCFSLLFLMQYLILRLFHGIIEVSVFFLQRDVHIMNAALERHLYQSWKGNF